MIEQDPKKIEERLKDVVIEFGLRRATAVADGRTITVREPSIWESGAELVVVVEDHDL